MESSLSAFTLCNRDGCCRYCKEQAGHTLVLPAMNFALLRCLLLNALRIACC